MPIPLDGGVAEPPGGQVAELVSQVRANREIARVLSLSPRTVETYLARVFSKLGASCRVEVAGKVAQLLRTPAS
ncbi:MAG: response regulator transcription factor [Pseudonocardiaceae bacterium]